MKSETEVDKMRKRLNLMIDRLNAVMEHAHNKDLDDVKLLSLVSLGNLIAYGMIPILAWVQGEHDGLKIDPEEGLCTLNEFLNKGDQAIVEVYERCARS